MVSVATVTDEPQEDDAIKDDDNNKGTYSTIIE